MRTSIRAAKKEIKLDLFYLSQIEKSWLKNQRNLHRKFMMLTLPCRNKSRDLKG